MLGAACRPSAAASERLRSARHRARRLDGSTSSLAAVLRAASASVIGSSPRARRSTFSRSCARARWMRLLTVPAGEPGDLLNLFVAQLFHVAQDEALAERRLELLDRAAARCARPACPPSARRAARAPDRPLGARVAERFLGDRVELVLLARVAHAQVLHAVLAEVDRDSVDPGRELRVAAEADRSP